MLLCPSIWLTLSMLIPLLMAMVAKVWRAQWKEIRNKTETDIRKAKGMVNVTIPFLFRLKAAKPKEESINVVSSGHDIVQGKIESRIKVFYITSGIAEQNSMNTVLASNDNRCCSVDVSSVV